MAPNPTKLNWSGVQIGSLSGTFLFIVPLTCSAAVAFNFKTVCMNNRATLSINFFPRKRGSKPNKFTIYCRITVDGERMEFSLQKKLEEHLWNGDNKRGKGHSPYVRSLNSYLDQVYTGLHEAHRTLVLDREKITPLAIKQRYMGIWDNGRTLKDLISYHNGTMYTSIKPGTQKNYHSTERCIDQFLLEEYKVSDILLRKLNHKFIMDFEQYLRQYTPSTRSMCNNNGAMKHMERLKKMSRLAVKLGWLDRDPFRDFKLRFEKAKSEFLTGTELKLMEGKTFGKKSMERSRDIFLFACYTGLSYIDVKELTSDSFIKGMDGNDWLYLDRAKTGETLSIPLLPKARGIIDKYGGFKKIGGVRLLPVQSNQKINANLKLMARACGITKRVTFHVARHTFATTITLSNGMPIETVSKLLGHTKLKSTQIYARVVDKKVWEDMLKLREKLEGRM